jgi:hypothetical protein
MYLAISGRYIVLECEDKFGGKEFTRFDVLDIFAVENISLTKGSLFSTTTASLTAPSPVHASSGLPGASGSNALVGSAPTLISNLNTNAAIQNPSLASKIAASAATVGLTGTHRIQMTIKDSSDPSFGRTIVISSSNIVPLFNTLRLANINLMVVVV